MKVLQINSVCGVGSTGRIVADLANTLQNAGHKCVIAYGREPSKTSGVDTIKIGSNYDIYMHALYTRLTDKSGFASTIATQRFIKQAKRYNPDVIHLHNIHGYFINIELLFDYLKQSVKPVVWTLHDCWSFTGHCAYFDYVSCDKWRTICSKCPQTNSYPAGVLLDNSKSNYQKKKELFTSIDDMTIVTPSKWLASLVEESYLSKYPITIINNGIDLSILKPKESEFRKKNNIEDKYIVLGVANVWDQRKGLDSFITLSKTLSNEFQIVLIGLTEKQRYELPKNIIGIAMTNSTNELVEIYSSADVFVNPTLEDNFPTTNLEALACGTPVITYDTGGSPESIDETSGIVIPKGNISALISAIGLIRNNPEKFQRCIKRSEIFNKTHRYNDYIGLYSNKLTQKETK